MSCLRSLLFLQSACELMHVAAPSWSPSFVLPPNSRKPLKSKKKSIGLRVAKCYNCSMGAALLLATHC